MSVLQEAEERRKAREMKKYSKQVQAEKQKERAQQKKREMDDVDKWRKQRKGGAGAEFDPDAVGGKGARMTPKMAAASAGKRFEHRDKSKKRVVSGPGCRSGRCKETTRPFIVQARDSKYGFGGPKRLSKQNDARSAADMSAFKPMKAKGGVQKGGKKGAAKRPGKSRRQSQRGKN